MTSYRIRPRFQQRTHWPMERVQDTLKAKLAEPGSPCRGLIIPGYIVLRIPHEERHFWSPQLSVALEESPEGTVLRGLYGPSPTVWTLFLFGYASLGLIALFISIIGFSRMSLGLNASILWILVLLGLVALAMWLTAQMGQKVGAEQTFRLHHFFEEAIHEKVVIS